MEKFVWIGILVFSSFVAFAQTETTTKINEKEKIVKIAYPLSIPQILILPELQQPISPLYKPIVSLPNDNSYFISKIDPYALDFGFPESQQILFSNKLSVLLSKKDEIYSGMGAVYVAQISLVWRANNWLTVTGGSFLNKQFTLMNLSPVISYGVNSLIKYSITKKVELNIYGNYLNKNPEDPFSTMNSLFTQTKIGSEISFKKDELQKVGIGMDQQYNVISKQWQPVYGTKITCKFPVR